MKLFKKKIFKYGAFAMALTCVTIAVVVVVNVIFASLASHFFWYVDMTGEEYYDVSENAEKLLEKVDPESDVTIYFLADKDLLSMGASSSDSYGATTLWGMKYIHEVALELSDSFDFISVDYIDLYNEPARVREIVGTDYYQSNTFNRFDVIIDNKIPTTPDGGSETEEYYHNYRVFTRDAFYSFSHSTLAVSSFRGDYRFASAILAITNTDAPTVYFISGHAEAVGEYYYGKEENETDNNYGAAQSVWQFFRDCGYNIRKINLQYEDFEEGEAIAVIFAPQTDFIDGTVSEIEKLESFLAEESHDLWLFMEPTSRQMPNLEGLINEYCHLTFEQAKIKADASSAVSVDGYTFAADIAENSVADSVMGRLQIDGKVVFANARPIAADPDFEGTSTLCYVPEQSSMIYSSEKTETADDDEMSLLTLTQLENDNNVLCCGSTGFIAGAMMDSDVYVNRDLMYSCMSEAGFEDLPINLKYKFIRNEGVDITLMEARLWTVVVSAVIPLAVAAAGIIVYVRRRHS